MRFLLAALVAVVVLTGCTHSPNPSAQLVSELNDLCRQGAAALSGHFPTPSTQVAQQLSAGQLTPEAASFLGQVADAFLTAEGPISDKVQSLPAKGADRQLLQRYESVIMRSTAALQDVRDAVARSDLAAVSLAWARFQDASRANSSMNAELGLTACGTLES